MQPLDKALTRPIGDAGASDTPAPMLRGDRRQITALFCDLVDWTLLTNRLEPEDLAELTVAYYAMCCRHVEATAGHVARLEGDGVLAYFGYPVAREDAVVGALKAALAIQASLARGDLQGRMDLRVRIGMATGMTLVSDLVGQGYSQMAVALGPTPNLAKRLQTLALPGQVVVSHETRRLAGAAFAFADLGVHSLHGFDEAQRAWQLEGPAGTGLRHDIRASMCIPCVGRDEQQAVLLEAWHQVTMGRGQALLVVGSPGIGKSRLLKAFAERAAPADSLWWQCDPGHLVSPLQPALDWLRRTLRGADAQQAFRFLDQWAGPESPVGGVEFLLELAGWEATPRSTLPAVSRRDQLHGALLSGLKHQARCHPMVVLVEDIHWSDDSTQELLFRLVDDISERPLLLVLSSRPDGAAAWRQRIATVLDLGSLDPADARTVALSVAKGACLDKAALEQVLDRADGVPLYLEELTAAVVAQRSVAALSRVPTSLQDSLAARLDLMGEARELARIGSAFGREFDVRCLARVCDWPSDRLQAGLNSLVEAGLLSPLTSVGSHVFKHALIQQAAYEGMLRSDRQAVHRRIVAALEQEDPGLVVREPALLAQHCQRAGWPQREVGLWCAAAQAAARVAAVGPALAAYEQASTALSQLPESSDRLVQQIEVLLGMMDVGRFAILPNRLAAMAAQARDLARQAGVELDASTRATLLFQDARAKLYTSCYAEARTAFDELRQLGVRLGDQAITRRPGSALAMTLCCQGLFGQMLEFLDESDVAQYQAVGNQIDHLAGLGWLGYARCQTGWGDGGLVHGHRAVAEAQNLRSPIYLAGALVWRSHALMAVRRLDEAVIDAQSSHDLGVETGVPYLRWHALVFLALYEARRCQPDLARQALEQARGLLADAAHGQWSLLDYLPAIEAECALAEGRVEHALTAATATLKVAESIDGCFAQAMAWRVRALALLKQGGAMADADAAHRRSQQLYRRGHAKAEGGYTALLWSQALAAAGHAHRSREAEQAAVQVLRSAGLDPDRVERFAETTRK